VEEYTEDQAYGYDEGGYEEGEYDSSLMNQDVGMSPSGRNRFRASSVFWINDHAYILMRILPTVRRTYETKDTIRYRTVLASVVDPDL
jgi:hypothetical protein